MSTKRHLVCGLAFRSNESDAVNEPCNDCGCPRGRYCNEDEDGNGYHVYVFCEGEESFWVCPGDCAMIQFENQQEILFERWQVHDAAGRLGGDAGKGTFE